ncbi:MAG: class II fumarate hydratase [Nitrospinae bacterium]|nr:class II fumarate hydratase [Nitrospinota bacterium]
MKYRTESDSLGQMEVPADAYYGVHTTRSIHNFPISGLTVPPEQIRAIALLKLACAKANMELGLLPMTKGNAIVKAAREVAEGKFPGQFPIDIFQAGSGTSTNMNVNEVIANRADELLGGKRGARGLVHPNDHVNMGQSTNNVFPSSIRVAALPRLFALIASAEAFRKTLARNGRKFDRIIKSGRTHLQDAVPIRMGQVFSAFAYAIEKDVERLKSKIPHISELGVGGNAVGTGINTHPRFRALIIKHLNRETGLTFRVTKNGIEATHGTNDLADLSAAAQTLAVDVARICNDLRLMASGPLTGFNEIRLPAVEPGSSIMPGKINPSICEAANMTCLKVFGNHQTITLAALAAQLELNVTMPVTGYALLESLNILSAAIRVLDEKCVVGIEVNAEQCRKYAMESPSIATFLNPVIGYDRAAAVVKKALKEKMTVPQVVLEEGILTQAELKKILDPKRLTSPGLYRK